MGAEHRALTRERIVECAARRFRQDGYEAAALGEIMKDAGLTVGGFYAHFASKEELFAEAIALAGRQALDARTPVSVSEPGDWVRAFVAGYLSAEHLADAAGGCPIAALGGDVARVGAAPRVAYRGAVDCFVEALEAHLEGDEGRRRAVAQAVMSMCVGALSIARAGLAPAEAQALFAACARSAEELVR